MVNPSLVIGVTAAIFLCAALAKVGDEERAINSLVESSRWLFGGVIIAGVSDVILHTNFGATFLWAIGALVVMMFIEYYLDAVKSGWDLFDALGKMIRYFR